MQEITCLIQEIQRTFGLLPLAAENRWIQGVDKNNPNEK
jgi:hypothetical protein